MNDYPKTEITGVILAGGRAERMGGQDKGLLPLLEQPLVAHVLRILQPQVGELFINANRNLAEYGIFGCRVIGDSVGEFLGPLAGMLAALEAADTEFILSAPCDSPLLPGDYAARMYAALAQTEAEIGVAYDGQRLQPVFALLRVELQGSLRGYLAAGGRKIDRWFAQRRLVRVDFSDHTNMFRNVNTPAELTALEAELRG